MLKVRGKRKEKRFCQFMYRMYHLKTRGRQNVDLRSCVTVYCNKSKYVQKSDE